MNLGDFERLRLGTLCRTGPPPDLSSRAPKLRPREMPGSSEKFVSIRRLALPGNIVSSCPTTKLPDLNVRSSWTAEGASRSAEAAPLAWESGTPGNFTGGAVFSPTLGADGAAGGAVGAAAVRSWPCNSLAWTGERGVAVGPPGFIHGAGGGGPRPSTDRKSWPSGESLGSGDVLFLPLGGDAGESGEGKLLGDGIPAGVGNPTDGLGMDPDELLGGNPAAGGGGTVGGNGILDALGLDTFSIHRLSTFFRLSSGSGGGGGGISLLEGVNEPTPAASLDPGKSSNGGASRSGGRGSRLLAGGATAILFVCDSGGASFSSRGVTWGSSSSICFACIHKPCALLTQNAYACNR